MGPPRDGEVEIAYFTLPEFEGKGYAKSAAKTLMDIASKTHVTVSAKTLPEESASTSILCKLGLVDAGDTIDHEIGRAWRWVHTPD